MSNRRSEQLRAIASEFCRVHDAWVEDDNRPAPDEVYWDACDAIVESFGSGDIPADCRTLADAVERFVSEVERFDDREDATDVYPHDAFWTARERIAVVLLGAEKAAAKALQPLESIVVLRAQGVGDAQIAMIYGFRDRNGNWMPQLVQREIDQPGSVLKTPGAVDGRDWRDPRIKDGDAANEPAERHAEALSRKKRRAAKNRQACPETPEDLWRQKVTVQQAARMLGLSESEVAEMFSDFEKEHEAAILGGEKVDATTQAIRELAGKGRSVKQIVEELKVDPAKVKEAMKGVQGVGQGQGQQGQQQTAAAGV
jgi:hypothetical protein